MISVKKLFKQALVENNIDYILTQALSQVQGGAEILDVNVGPVSYTHLQVRRS